jgi:Rrf2 family protein
MIDLAEHGGDTPVSRQLIAGRQEISADYIAQLLRPLQAAGLVEGVKGPGGGYRLSREAETITAGDVIRAVEGPIALVECVLDNLDAPLPCHRVDRCVAHGLWEELTEAVAGVLDSATLRNLADRAQELSPEERKL